MSAATEHDTQRRLRMSREAKDKVERAAAVSGQSVSDFFFALPEADQEPSEKTKEAVRRYNTLSSGDATG